METVKETGTQIDVSICFTEYSQLSSLAAELWTPCCPLFLNSACKTSCLKVRLQNSIKIPLGTGFDTHTKAQGTKCENQRQGTDHMKRRVESQKKRQHVFVSNNGKSCVRLDLFHPLCGKSNLSTYLRAKNPGKAGFFNPLLRQIKQRSTYRLVKEELNF